MAWLSLRPLPDRQARVGARPKRAQQQQQQEQEQKQEQEVEVEVREEQGQRQRRGQDTEGRHHGVETAAARRRRGTADPRDLKYA
ncbi:hypothetical protein KEM52_003893, partial [Ascosphaera acerosa]